MTLPLAILAFFAIALGVIGTPAWPWFRAFLENRRQHSSCMDSPSPACCMLMLMSSLVVFLGLGLGWWLYGNKSPKPEAPDALEKSAPWLWAPLRDRLYVDEIYGATVIAFYAWWARVADWLDRRIWGGIVTLVAWLFGLWARLNRFLDVNWVDGSFDKTCEELSSGGGLLSRVEAAACRTTCAFWPRPWSRSSQFFSGAAGHERARVPDSDAAHRAAARGRGHCAFLRPSCARCGALYHAGLPAACALHLDSPAR